MSNIIKSIDERITKSLLGDVTQEDYNHIIGGESEGVEVDEKTRLSDTKTQSTTLPIDSSLSHPPLSTLPLNTQTLPLITQTSPVMNHSKSPTMNHTRQQSNQQLNSEIQSIISSILAEKNILEQSNNRLREEMIMLQERNTSLVCHV